MSRSNSANSSVNNTSSSFSVSCYRHFIGHLVYSKYFSVLVLAADHSGRPVQGMKCLRPLKHWGREFESHWRHGCLCVFILCLCCPVCR
jgi:hypothetical protein